MIRTLGLGLAALTAALVVVRWNPSTPDWPAEASTASQGAHPPPAAAADEERAPEGPDARGVELDVDEESVAPAVRVQSQADPPAPLLAAGGFVEEILTDRSGWGFDEGAANDVAAPAGVEGSRPEQPVEQEFEFARPDAVPYRAPHDPDRSATLIRRLLRLYETVGSHER